MFADRSNVIDVDGPFRSFETVVPNLCGPHDGTRNRSKACMDLFLRDFEGHSHSRCLFIRLVPVPGGSRIGIRVVSLPIDPSPACRDSRGALGRNMFVLGAVSETFGCKIPGRSRILPES